MTGTPPFPVGRWTRRRARLCRALGNPIRLGILRLLSDGTCKVSELVERLCLEQSKVSKHLAVLREAGLIRCSVEGRCRCYRLTQPERTTRLFDLLDELVLRPEDPC